MITIMKASAGSGKTYNLAKTYIRLLLQNPDPTAYRHILAVTFTNKATDEMKRRILKELHVLATEPEKSHYFKHFVPSVCPDVETLKKISADRLRRILHDYGAFAVSTIDSFFQRALKAFSREIGQFASYQVEIDRDSLVTESVDRLLDGLTSEDKETLSWLTDGSMDSLAMGERFKISSLLSDIAPSLASDRFREALESSGLDAEEIFSKDRLRDLRKFCDSTVTSFEERVSAAAEAVVKAFADAGVSIDDTNGKFAKALFKYIGDGKKLPIEKPTDPFIDKALDSSKWFAKAKAGLLNSCIGIVDPAFESFIDLFGTPFREYNTAREIRGQICSLGLAGALFHEFEALMKEKNVLCLDESNTILRDIINGSDAPFVYEKLGVRFEDFLLDEFQDTSTIQWENFRPLLENSEAGGNENLVVGDVKQSIYRFRGSDWRLLDKTLPSSFTDKKVEPLTGNFRTLKEIVSFNNEFFPAAARTLSVYLGEDPNAPDSVASTIYKDIGQQVRSRDDAPGSVDVSFFESAEEEMDEIVATVSSLLERGARPEDVAILVRGNKEGSEIASRLISEGFSIVSDDSLNVKSSAAVRLVVSGFALVDNPPKEDGRIPIAAFEAHEAGISVPESYDSLYDLAEKLISSILEIRPEILDGEASYVQSFMDYLQDWVSRNGNSIAAFLEKWKEDDPKIASPEGKGSVRIMTIHKSKGLEFPYVILPFIEKITLFKSANNPFIKDKGNWCLPESKGTVFSSVDGIFNVKFTKSSVDTLFAESYLREIRLQAIDAFNIMYVAMTRPQKGLKVIGKNPKNSISSMSEILHAYTGGDISVGEPYDFSTMRRRESQAATVELGYPVFRPDEGGRLRVSSDASDYFGEDGATGLSASNRIRGIVLHGILSSVKVPSDLAGAVDKAVLDGLVPAGERDKILEFLKGEIESVSVRGWFPEEPSRVLNETTLIDADGTVHRPDRIVTDGSSAIVIDYKFGQEKNFYRTQIARYAAILKRIGFTSVESHLWYIREDGDDLIL